jgi:phosphomannomutase
MPAELIISVSGLRGIVGESLTTQIAARYVEAFIAELPPGPLVVGRDGRASGAMFAEAIGEVLTRAGRHMLDAGVAATPTIGVLVRDLRAVGGVQISASHNPPEYNGLKLFSAAGRVIPAPQGQGVLDRFRNQQKSPLSGASPAVASDGAPQAISDCISAHLELIDATCNVERIRARRFRVLLDANHGAGGALGQALLEHLGCQPTILGGTPDGAFAHPPEPTEANLATVLAEVVNARAAVGFCQDPDADRLAIVDERGRYIGEEKTLALCVEHVLASGRRGPVVTNCSTSRMSEDLAHKYGAPFYRSKVGEANVVDLMLQHNAVIGGEGNGGVIDPRVGLVRDSFVGMALVLDAMAARDAAVGTLADGLPPYAIHKSTIAVASGELPAALDALERELGRGAAADQLDGLRLDWPDGAWLLVRPSNTEPIVRAIAEAPTADQARELCRWAAAAIKRHGPQVDAQ